jgi:hypothetical protein
MELSNQPHAPDALPPASEPGWTILENIKVLSLPGSEPRPIQSKTTRFTNWAIPANLILYIRSMSK